MIATPEQASRKKVECQFRELAGLLLPGKIWVFVKSIIVYADESGTHDETGKEKGSEYPMIPVLPLQLPSGQNFGLNGRPC